MTAALKASLSFTISWSLLKLTAIEWVMPSNHLILCRPLLLPPSIFPSISVFSNELTPRIRWSKYWSFSFSISPSNEYSGLISFRIEWFDLLIVQESPPTLQHLVWYKFKFWSSNLTWNQISWSLGPRIKLLHELPWTSDSDGCCPKYASNSKP